MGENYLKGLNGALLIARFIDGPISENLVDDIKEIITRNSEWIIDSSLLSIQEKEEQKRWVKQSTDAYNRGIKDGLRMEGRLM